MIFPHYAKYWWLWLCSPLFSYVRIKFEWTYFLGVYFHKNEFWSAFNLFFHKDLLFEPWLHKALNSLIRIITFGGLRNVIAFALHEQQRSRQFQVKDFRDNSIFYDYSSDNENLNPNNFWFFNECPRVLYFFVFFLMIKKVLQHRQYFFAPLKSTQFVTSIAVSMIAEFDIFGFKLNIPLKNVKHLHIIFFR